MGDPRVVIVGGGPAGLAAAIALARHQIPTLLVERGRLPRNKPCGEGLLPRALAGLLELGLERAELEAAGSPLTGIRYIAPSGRVAEAGFGAAGVGLGLRRVRLSQLLLARAQALPALRIVQGVRAEVALTAGRPTVSFSGERWQPALVVGADGLHSNVRRACGWGTVYGTHRRFGMRQHFALAPWSDHVEVYFARAVEAYVTPVGDSVNIAFLWEPARLSASSGVPRFGDLLAHFPALERRLGAAGSEGQARGAGPFDRRPARRAQAGLVLLGDASGYIDALTGEGVGLALTQALALERALVPFFKAAPEPTAATAASAGGERLVPVPVLGQALLEADAACRSHRQLTRLLLGLLDRPQLLERAIASLAADPALFQHFLHVNAGRQPLWRIPLRSALRLPRTWFGELRV